MRAGEPDAHAISDDAGVMHHAVDAAFLARLQHSIALHNPVLSQYCMMLGIILICDDSTAGCTQNAYTLLSQLLSRYIP